jgi:hypothetical protein
MDPSGNRKVVRTLRQKGTPWPHLIVQCCGRASKGGDLRKVKDGLVKYQAFFIRLVYYATLSDREPPIEASLRSFWILNPGALFACAVSIDFYLLQSRNLFIARGVQDGMLSQLV